MSTFKDLVKKTPIVGPLAKWLIGKLNATPDRPMPFPGSVNYWEGRYASGGNSGVGSYDKFAEFKAETINSFVRKNDVASVIEFGCGDGNQLELAAYPEYLGLDVSETAVAMCRDRFQTDSSKTFGLMRDYNAKSADLVLSLDVIYHLIEDDIFERYVNGLFAAARRYVIIYSSNSDDNRGYEGTHVKHRKFTDWIEDNISEWRMKEYIPNRYPYEGDYKKGSFADFYIYERISTR